MLDRLLDIAEEGLLFTSQGKENHVLDCFRRRAKDLPWGSGQSTIPFLSDKESSPRRWPPAAPPWSSRRTRERAHHHRGAARARSGRRDAAQGPQPGAGTGQRGGPGAGGIKPGRPAVLSRFLASLSPRLHGLLQTVSFETFTRFRVRAPASSLSGAWHAARRGAPGPQLVERYFFKRSLPCPN